MIRLRALRSGTRSVSVTGTMRSAINRSMSCNGMSGPWRIEHGRLIAGPLVSTEMWCHGKMEQERAVGALLAAAPEIKVGASRMTLTAGGHSAELVRN